MPQPIIQEPIPQSSQDLAKQVMEGQQDQELLSDVDYQRLFNFEEAKINLKGLITSWATQETVTATNRALRKLDIDVNQLQAEGKIDSDETIIPTRTIDSNIKREQTVFISYLQQSRRIATFTAYDAPALDTQSLESEFSRGMTYKGWMIPHVKTVDGTQTHGWDSVEVVFDETKPLHVSIEHIGHEKMIFPLDARDLQALETVIRVYTVTQPQLRQFVREFGFSADQVRLLLERYSETRKNESITIYKQLFKFQGVVYTAWFEIAVTTNWLKAPGKLYLGRKEKIIADIPVEGIDPMTRLPTVQMTQQEVWQEVDETEFPIFLLPYEQLEDEKIVSNQGRVFLDQGKQVALTAIASGYVNGVTRASQIYGSPKQGTGGRPMVMDDVRMVPGRIYSEQIEFWSTPYPDASVLSGFQALLSYNDAEAGQVNYAVNNRQDSRKTAEEIKTATQEQGLLRSVQITNFSSWIRDVYTFCYQIVKSQAIQGKIKFMSRQPEYLQLDYDIRAAGDTDVIQRAELLNRMKQDWPVIGTTPLAQPFLLDMIKISYPDNAARYTQIMQQQDPNKLWIQSVMPVLPVLMQQLKPGSVQPEEMEQLQALYQQGQQLVGQQPQE